MASGKGQGAMACLMCFLVLLCVLLGILGLVGLCLAIWQIVDALHTNQELMNLARLAVPDDSLLNAIYVFMAFTAFSMCFGGAGGKSRSQDGDDDKQRMSFCGLGVSLILVAGYLASGILGAKYKNNSLPKLEDGMKTLLADKAYLNPDTPISKPEYSNIGKRFNYLQAEHKCCGVTLPNGQDYANARFPQRYNLTVPYSCCVLRDDGDTSLRETSRDDVKNYPECSKFNPEYFHTKTCFKTEHDWLTFKCNFIMGYNFTMVCLGLGLAIILCCFVACVACMR